MSVSGFSQFTTALMLFSGGLATGGAWAISTDRGLPETNADGPHSFWKVFRLVRLGVTVIAFAFLIVSVLAAG
ncbi:hypothetical protein F3087_40395 [Nocardia colli]|uniref:HIG1 domain-containing protein n=1 Tax=Nocardia colli TaxID=2545717 RepID=A0A5N0DV01_9NOCA|nr:hypothetical protein [Nocardia colli]KAA8880583.1 hypothetical protein F3087_40395 [Nocardia colli]